MGESIILIIPPNQAVVIDSLLHPQNTGDCPALDFLLDKNIEIAALVLTHPHKDHAEGFDRLVQHCKGPIGCGKFFLDQVSLYDPQGDYQQGSAAQGLASIKSRWDKEPSTVWQLETNSSVTFGNTTLTALHPSASQAREMKKANDLSTPILVEWKEARVVLGAELPKRFWSTVNSSFETTKHHAYKIAHHCSENNFEVGEFQGPRNRFWVATPCRRKPQPPRFEDGQGVDLLLGCVDQVFLTSVLFEVEDRESGAVPRSRLRDLAEAVKTQRGFGGVEFVPQLEARDPQQAYVLASWDQDGRLVEVVRGLQSVIVSQG